MSKEMSLKVSNKSKEILCGFAGAFAGAATFCCGLAVGAGAVRDDKEKETAIIATAFGVGFTAIALLLASQTRVEGIVHNKTQKYPAKDLDLAWEEEFSPQGLQSQQTQH